MTAPLKFPNFDPVLLHIGPLSIRWYALAYITGLVLGWWGVRRLARATPPVASLEQVDDFLTWATLGVVFGGRLGYCLFYQPAEYLPHPWEILQVWEGGMSFHGGFLGVCIAAVIYCWQQRIPFFGFIDRVAVVTPIGLGLGRCANFINGELYGRAAPPGLPWAMIFPRDPQHIPRHPSQLYQATMEGLLLFLLLFACSRFARLRARFGFLSGVFLVGYGTARIIGEFFREPDEFLGYLWEGATMGQLLSFPMVIGGLGLIGYAFSRPPRTGNPGAA
jgi:phosphatidylglycerol:prolipoprotein diacylglycerol transferase